MPARSPKNSFFLYLSSVFHRHSGYKSLAIYRDYEQSGKQSFAPFLCFNVFEENESNERVLDAINQLVSNWPFMELSRVSMISLGTRLLGCPCLL